MVLDLKVIFDNPSEKLEFSHELDLSKVELWGSCPLKQPVKISGSVINRSTIVTLSFTADFILSFNCDRCAEPTEKPELLSFEHVLVTSLNEEDNDDFVLVENAKLDLDELVSTDILLNIPIKLLCKDNCKGICPHCGKNLNIENCNCSSKQIDPRLEALKKLID